MAKCYFNLADSSVHESASHLGFTHLFGESVVIATHRYLAPSHPIFRLLAPHFLYLLAINEWDVLFLKNKFRRSIFCVFRPKFNSQTQHSGRLLDIVSEPDQSSVSILSVRDIKHFIILIRRTNWPSFFLELQTPLYAFHTGKLVLFVLKVGLKERGGGCFTLFQTRLYRSGGIST